jgi:hypothetical protein
MDKIEVQVSWKPMLILVFERYLAVVVGSERRGRRGRRAEGARRGCRVGVWFYLRICFVCANRRMILHAPHKQPRMILKYK